MDESIENKAIRRILQPSVHLIGIFQHFNLDGQKDILRWLVNEDVDTLLKHLEGLIKDLKDVNNEDIEELTLQLQIRSFVNELRESYATIRDLYYHKDDGNAINILNIVNSTLQKYNVDNYQQIGAEIYSHILDQSKTKDSPKTSLRKKAEDAEARQTLKDNLKYQSKK